MDTMLFYFYFFPSNPKMEGLDASWMLLIVILLWYTGTRLYNSINVTSFLYGADPHLVSICEDLYNLKGFGDGSTWA